MSTWFTERRKRLQEPNRLSWRSLAVLFGIAVLYLLFRNLPWVFITSMDLWTYVIVGAIVVPLTLAHTLVRATGAALIVSGFLLLEHFVWAVTSGASYSDAVPFVVVLVLPAALLELAHVGSGPSRWAWWRYYVGGVLAFLITVVIVELQAQYGLIVLMAYAGTINGVLLACLLGIRVLGGVLDRVGAHGTLVTPRPKPKSTDTTKQP